jgi:hypothetical protein
MRRFHGRGQHEIPLHWIFALVGGALFLLFFFILIRSVTTQHEEKSGRDLAFAVETIVTTAAATPDTFTVTDLQDAKYAFACERDAASFLSYVFVEGAAKQAKAQLDTENLRYVPVFSPSSVSGDQLFTSTRAWEAPFPVGSLVLLSNNRTRYVLVGDTRLIKSFVEEENLGGFDILRKGRDAFKDVKDEGLDQYRFVFFNTGFQLPPQEFLGKRNGALVVHTDDNGETGTLDFYDNLRLGANAPSKKGVPFAGRALLDAAIFSQDSNSFDCNMLKARERLNTTITILQRRLEVLGNGSALQLKCGPLFDEAKAALIAYSNSPDRAFAAAAAGSGPIILLSSINQRAFAADCPSIY